MRIGVNAVPLRESGGGARYVFTELMERLAQLDRENEYVIFAHFLGLGVVNRLRCVHPHLSPELPAQRRVRVIEVACEEDILRHRDQFDLFFGPLNNLQPRIYDRPSVAVLHDIQEQYFPQYFPESELLARREIYPEICRSATTLVTISEFCKQTIVEKFGIDPEKIEVVYNAPQSTLSADAPHEPGSWRRAALPERFVFFPGNCYRHKNHGLLLDALRELKQSGAPLACVFTGFELPGGFPLRAEIAKRGLTDLCRIYEQVEVDELRHLYQRALALVMPTKFEGFCMPVTEALAVGCPVVCSDLPVLHEVAGEHALYFDPQRCAPLVECLRRVMVDEALRGRLRRGGQAAVRRFSWESSARRYIEIFRAAPARFLGFQPAVGKTVRAAAPRIGLLVTAARGAHGLPELVKDVMQTGYPNVALRVLLREHEDHDQARDFLRQTGIPHELLPRNEHVGWDRLRRFADETGADLVGELHAGFNRLLPTALHSLAWACAREPDKPVYLGEVWETVNGGFTRAARLRLLGDGLWKLEGGVYPGMLFLSVRQMDGWESVATLTAAAEWRWRLIKHAHRSGRLCQVRRTLATCEAAHRLTRERHQALRAGLETVYAGNGEPRNGSWLIRLKPVLKTASYVLPGSWRAKGKRIWKHLAREA